MRIPLEFSGHGRKWAMIVLAAITLASCRQSIPKPAAGSNAGPAQKAVKDLAKAQQSKLIVYPWSVVSGGVGSPNAMRAAMQEDPVVDAHYAGLNPAFFRAEA